MQKTLIVSLCYLYLLFFLSPLSFSDEEGLNHWMTERIQEIEKGGPFTVDAIYRYDVEGKTYFLFGIPGKDVAYPVYDSVGNAICTVGGFSGEGDGKCSSLAKKFIR